VLVTACKAACGKWPDDKDGRALKVRADNPAADVAPPDRGDDKQLQWLYPDEFLALISCILVPLVWRRIYALAAYLFVRLGELLVIMWDQVDLIHGVVAVRYAYDEDKKRKKQTKSGNKGIRRFSIEPALMPRLNAMPAELGGQGPVVLIPDRKHASEILRAHLRLAGVTRPELFQDDETNKNIRFHDLRSTGLTWLALRGDDPLKIQYRAGHQDFEMTQVYIRTAENLRTTGEAIGDLFPELPASLMGEAVEAVAVDDSNGPESSPAVPSVGNECSSASAFPNNFASVREDSNLHAFRRRNLKAAKPRKTTGIAHLRTQMTLLAPGRTEPCLIHVTMPLNVRVAATSTLSRQLSQPRYPVQRPLASGRWSASWPTSSRHGARWGARAMWCRSAGPGARGALHDSGKSGPPWLRGQFGRALLGVIRLGQPIA
jgi:hypothetical protein